MRSHPTAARHKALAADPERTTQDGGVEDPGDDLWGYAASPQSDQDEQPYEGDLIRALTAHGLRLDLEPQDVTARGRDFTTPPNDQPVHSRRSPEATASWLHRHTGMRWTHIAVSTLVGGLIGLGVWTLLLSDGEPGLSTSLVQEASGPASPFTPSGRVPAAVPPSAGRASTSRSVTSAVGSTPPAPAPPDPTSAAPGETPTLVGTVHFTAHPRRASAAQELFQSGPTKPQFTQMLVDCRGLGGSYITKAPTSSLNTDYQAHVYSVTWDYNCWAEAGKQ
jgi:hypothetical protein